MLVVGAVVTALGVYVLGGALVAESTPYGVAPLLGIVLTVTGALLLVRAGAGLGRTLAAGAVCAVALTAGLLGLPVDDSSTGPECLTGGGTLLDCDDPRIDTDAERATARPRGGPPPSPAPAVTPG